MPNQHDVGDTVRITGLFTDAAGAAADPTSVSIIVQKPDATETTQTDVVGGLVNSATGTWYRDVLVAAGEDGTWRFRILGTGAVVAAAEGEFHIRPQLVGV